MPNEAFFLEIQNFWAWQTNWADRFWGIWVIFGQAISTHFGTVSPLSMLFNHYFFKKLSLDIPSPNIYPNTLLLDLPSESVGENIAHFI